MGGAGRTGSCTFYVIYTETVGAMREIGCLVGTYWVSERRMNMYCYFFQPFYQSINFSPIFSLHPQHLIFSCYTFASSAHLGHLSNLVGWISLILELSGN